MQKSGNKPRNILLIEPKYKNKYPPIGLMKIATYHRILNDNVQFYKGDVKEFIINKLATLCISQLGGSENINWLEKQPLIISFIKTRRKKILNKILKDSNADKQQYIEGILYQYSNVYRTKKYNQYLNYDRIYITTLFTFYWDITVEAIKQAKLITTSIDNIKIGGILASLLSKELKEDTGIEPLTGLLDHPGILDDNDIIIDELPLDYSILDEINYKYPTGSAYFTFMTKGCTRKCAFCSVPKLEPIYKEKVPTLDKFNHIKTMYGEQQHLLLMDNNVLASPKFPEIIKEIKDMGFSKDAKFIEPNQLDIAIKNLKLGINDVAYINKSFTILSNFVKKNANKLIGTEIHNILKHHNLLNKKTITKTSVIAAYTDIKDIYELRRNKIPKKRYVDFNQGVDARYITEENMQLLSDIAIYPLRIAFDHIGIKNKYENAVRLAAKYNITRLSNYLLFNFKDKPLDLFRRMQLNVDLSEELSIHIYSFPMKYIPLFGEEAKHRHYIGKFWNRKFIRAIQAISNATRGIVPPGRSFFERAYGKGEDEFMELLYMPETYLVYRSTFEKSGYISQWQSLFGSLNKQELIFAKHIIESNNFSQQIPAYNNKIIQLLKHYQITRKQTEKATDKDYQKIKHKFDRFIDEDQFVNTTLTYDFERRIAIS